MAKNPNELDVICHKGRSGIKTLTTTAEFYIPKEGDECPFREPSLSRLDMSLILKDASNTEVLVFNIPAKEINEVKLKSDIAVKELMTAPTATTNSGTDDFANSPAFTVQLMLTAFKGRTPGEVLTENPAHKDELIKGRAWLESNLSKFPANKKQIDAINEALTLLDIGELDGRTSAPQATSKILTVYERNCKHKSKKDEKGNNLVYSISVTCDPSKDFPFEISVMNCYAPVSTNESGQTVVKMSAAINVKKGSIAVSDSEWIGWIGQAYDLYQNFKRINAPLLFERVAKNSYSSATSN